MGGLVVRDVHLEQLVRALAGKILRLLLERQADPGPQRVVVRHRAQHALRGVPERGQDQRLGVGQRPIEVEKPHGMLGHVTAS